MTPEEFLQHVRDLHHHPLELAYGLAVVSAAVVSLPLIAAAAAWRRLGDRGRPQ